MKKGHYRHLGEESYNLLKEKRAIINDEPFTLSLHP